MCGIVGMISLTGFGFNNSDVTRFNQMLVCDSVRGPDSTGVFGVNKYGNCDFLKEKGDPFKLINTPEYKEFADKAYRTYQFVIGHNRKATVGSVSDETAHPFQEGNIVLVHNGTLFNHKALTDQEVSVDSHAITHAIVEKGYKKAIKELQGAFTLVWYDATDKCLRFVRNDQRPLNLVKTTDRIYLSSEAALAEWILTRDLPTTKYTVEEVKSGTVYTINLNEPKEIKKERVQFYTAPKVPIVTVPKYPLVEVPQEKKPGTLSYTGWKGYECSVGERILVTVESVLTLKTADTSGYAAMIRAFRIFKNQPPVYIYVTEEELEDYTESGESQFMVTVTKISDVTDVAGAPYRIYAKNLEEYVPEYEGAGEEVLCEEWRIVKDHKCKRCGKETYWKDINGTRFKFKSPERYRIVCQDCMDTQRRI